MDSSNNGDTENDYSLSKEAIEKIEERRNELSDPITLKRLRSSIAASTREINSQIAQTENYSMLLMKARKMASESIR